MKDLNLLTDEELVRLHKQGDAQAFEEICARYRPAIRSLARHYFLVGGDEDDLAQEGLIGLFTAVTRYDGDRPTCSSFKTFSYHCIKNKMINLVHGAGTEKNKVFANSVSLGEISDGKEEPSSQSPEDSLIDEERFNESISEIKKRLSPLEGKVFDLFVQGQKYQEIAKALNKTPKSIDNAIQRIKEKTKVFRRQ